MYRQYFEYNNQLLHLPHDLTATPNNPLLRELKASFNFNEAVVTSAEYSREIFLSSLEFFKFLLVRDWVHLIQPLGINLALVKDYLFFFIFGHSNLNQHGSGAELFRNPARPLRKGVSSMLRIHATGAVAMPIEVRLQILASSKDVIHSWAVPSAGVKIDCVPGYTSHKIMIFFMEGIYWGQCMEICGRMHH